MLGVRRACGIRCCRRGHPRCHSRNHGVLGRQCLVGQVEGRLRLGPHNRHVLHDSVNNGRRGLLAVAEVQDRINQLDVVHKQRCLLVVVVCAAQGARASHKLGPRALWWWRRRRRRWRGGGCCCCCCGGGCLGSPPSNALSVAHNVNSRKDRLNTLAAYVAYGGRHRCVRVNSKEELVICGEVCGYTEAGERVGRAEVPLRRQPLDAVAKHPIHKDERKLSLAHNRTDVRPHRNRPNALPEALHAVHPHRLEQSVQTSCRHCCRAAPAIALRKC